MTIAITLRAFANERRLQILDWLKNPRAHFREQVDGDLVSGLQVADGLRREMQHQSGLVCLHMQPPRLMINAANRTIQAMLSARHRRVIGREGGKTAHR